MWNAEGLVQIKVHHIWSKLTGLSYAYQCIQVGSIHVNLSTKALNNFTDAADFFFKNSMS